MAFYEPRERFDLAMVSSLEGVTVLGVVSKVKGTNSCTELYLVISFDTRGFHRACLEICLGMASYWLHLLKYREVKLSMREVAAATPLDYPSLKATNHGCQDRTRKA